MRLTVFNQLGKKKTTLELGSKIIEREAKPVLIAQAVATYLSNRRYAKAKTKGRGEVSGGGRKPWRQKGTGRARAGSIRSPLWRGGGITFGPTGKENYQKKMTQKMRRRALLSSLSAKIGNKELILVDKIELKNYKTKDLENIFQRLPLKEGTILLILEDKNEIVQKSGQNLSYLSIKIAPNLNTYDILGADTIVTTAAALKKIIDFKEKNAIKKD